MGGDEPLDLLVLGSGVAGLTAAVQATERYGMAVGVLTKGALHQATTRWAQGGVAAVLADDPDSTDLHLADTLAAGAGLCDTEAVRVLVDEGPDRVHALIALGAAFDLDEQGGLALAREGGHSLARIVHAGGAATGVEIERALVDAVHATAAAVHEHAFAVDLLIESGRCAGVVAIADDGTWRAVRARHVLVATGGAGQVFSVTTNPLEVTGDGVAMALRAGAACADVEFVQFHPTALHHPRMPRPLLSEALRGHGALLRDHDGERFVDELLPRDEVSRAMTARMADQHVDHLWLDATGLERFAERFPTIADALVEAGLDPASDWLPIAPAAHYLCGGVLTDLDGATSLPGLWAAGEVACSGVHGANRLASNSLLEGMVFAHRVVEAIDRGRDGPEPTGAMRSWAQARSHDVGAPGFIGGRLATGWVPLRQPFGLEVGPALASDGSDPGPSSSSGVVASAAGPGSSGSGSGSGSSPSRNDAEVVAGRREQLQRTMTFDAGVLRDLGSLDHAAAQLRALASFADAGGGPGDDVAAHELANLLEVSWAIVHNAAERTESRGAHTRSDHPFTEDGLRVRLILGG